MTYAEGFAFDPQTNDWTKRIVYEARDRMEAVRWINFNRSWFKRLRIVDADEDDEEPSWVDSPRVPGNC